MNPGKRIEHFLKDLMTKILRGALEQKPRKPQPPYNRILFFRFDVLGDMILSLPVFRATRDASPAAKIDGITTGSRQCGGLGMSGIHLFE